MKISNPLTIIAVFAGVAESFAALTIGDLPVELQADFMNFVMFFPVLIVLLFFGVLIFKPHVLYAPTDFDDEKHFMSLNGLRGTIDNEVELTLKAVNSSPDPLSPKEINNLKNQLVTSTMELFSSEYENKALIHIKNNSRRTFSAKGLGQELAMETGSAKKILEGLENKGHIAQVENSPGEVIWQAKT